MTLETVRKTLLDFAADPNKSWGTPTDGSGAPTDISSGVEARVAVQQGDRNTARLNSGTYTAEQYADFDRQLGEVERRKISTAIFPGDPDNLPSDGLWERICSSCGKRFRSIASDAEVACYACALDRLCPKLPGRHIRAFWKREEWRMEGFGDVGFRNEMTFWWSNSNSGGNASHQGLVVFRDEKGVIRKLALSTVAVEARRCYTVNFDCTDGSVIYVQFASTVVDITSLAFAKRVVLTELDPLVVDFIVAMLPPWMLYTHRPRNPLNGCFA